MGRKGRLGRTDKTYTQQDPRNHDHDQTHHHIYQSTDHARVGRGSAQVGVNGGGSVTRVKGEYKDGTGGVDGEEKSGTGREKEMK